DGAINPQSYSPYVFGTSNNITLTENGIFLMGRATDTAAVPYPSIRYFDVENSLVTRIMGDQPSASAPDSTETPGLLKDLPVRCSYSSTKNCFNLYDKEIDRFYYSEMSTSAIRYIEKATQPQLSTLHSI